MKKLSKVVMLPTEKASDIIQCHDNRLWYNDTRYLKSYQHLYFLSDEEIEEGDWILDSYGGINSIYQFRKCDFDSTHFKGGYCKKIIATTDESLRSPTFHNYIHYPSGKYHDDEPKEMSSISIRSLPRPSNEFIKKYCELGGINEVLVEYESELVQTWPSSGRDAGGNEKYETIHTLKVAPDNTITIYPIV